MPTYLAPGVYVEELADVWGTPTPVLGVVAEPNFDWADAMKWQGERRAAAFVGFAERGPFDTPVRLDSFREFVEGFGLDTTDTAYLPTAVEAYFANGGRTCYVVRIGALSERAENVLPSALLGDERDRTGLAGLEVIDDLGFVAVPDLWAGYQRGAIDMDGVKSVQLAMIADAELMGDRIASIDPPPNLSSASVLEWRTEFALYDSMFAALYYPWIKTMHRGTGRVESVPPSGHVAGVIARCDQELGVHLPPANALVRHAVALENYVTVRERTMLNPPGINALVSLPGSGILVFGARTLSSSPQFRLLHHRRLIIEIESAIQRGTQWALFRMPTINNDDWGIAERLVTEISDYLYLLWLTGVLGGDVPDEAFTVECDRFTSPPEVRAAGQLIVQIRLAFGSGELGLRVVYFSP